MTLMGIKWCLERSRRGYQLDVGNDNKLDRQRRGRKSSLYIHTCQNDSGKGWGTAQGRSRVKEGLRLDPRVAGTSSAFVGIRHDRIINPGSTIAGDRRRGSMSSNATPKRQHRNWSGSPSRRACQHVRNASKTDIANAMLSIVRIRSLHKLLIHYQI